MRKRSFVTAFQRYALNPYVKLLAGYVGPVLLETTGRKSGKPRRTPVGAKRQGGSFWIVSEQGRHANYVRNIDADRRVRIRHRGRWHDGTAHVMPHEDARRHLHGINGLFVRLVGTELLVVRVDVR